MTLSQTQESDEEGVLPPHSPPLLLRDRRAPRSPSELVPPLLDQSYAPAVTVLLVSSNAMSSRHTARRLCSSHQCRHQCRHFTVFANEQRRRDTP